MSKPSPISPDTTPYKRYFGRIIQRLGGRVGFLEFGRSLRLAAEDVPLPRKDLPSYHPPLASVVILLRLSHDESRWVVREFSVSTTPNRFLTLWGEDFLQHYDKRPGGNDADLSRPYNRVWTMTRAADFQAMLEAYDRLAKEFGKPALFGH